VFTVADVIPVDRCICRFLRAAKNVSNMTNCIFIHESVCVCVRACVRARACVCVRVRMYFILHTIDLHLSGLIWTVSHSD
jgi:hypothetical protein